MLGRSSDSSRSAKPSQGDFTPVANDVAEPCETHSSGNCSGFSPDSLLISIRHSAYENQCNSKGIKKMRLAIANRIFFSKNILYLFNIRKLHAITLLLILAL